MPQGLKAEREVSLEKLAEQGGLSRKAPLARGDVMNQSLPIQNFRKEILAAIRDNSVVVITADTGAGKSTQVPQYLLEEGYDLVVTQPRRLAARTVSARVSQERGEKLGGIVGFRTAFERQDSEATRCLFCTDGLALVRELMCVGQHKVLVLDEVHEWNLNLEVLVAWAKLQLQRGVDFKVVLMSATLESAKLAEYFGGAPVIQVPGRLFPVTEEIPSSRLVDDVAKLLRQGRNVLVFQPGKAEIAKTIAELNELKVHAEILPLHGELVPEDQQLCFKHYARPKCVVSTNVAQTSVTIDDIDAVVDSGMEKRIELEDGVETLNLRPISEADSTQRKGRAGRTKPGIYIDHCPAMDRPDFPVAEILRLRLDQTVLRLAEHGFDAEELEFFHQPDTAKIHEAKRFLKALGCMDEAGKVTAIGHRIAKMPISVHHGRMVVEADRLGVVDDIIDIAAILEVGEVTARKVKSKKMNDWTGKMEEVDVPAHGIWQRRFCPQERESDLMAQLAVFHGTRGMSKDEMVKAGVNLRSLYRAREIRDHLAESLKGKVRAFESSGKRDDILRAVCAGMVDHLWKNVGFGYRNGDDQVRELNRGTVVYSAEWVVGLPFNLPVPVRRGAKEMITLYLVRMATKVDPKWLMEVAPQLVRQETGVNPRYDEANDCVVSDTQTYFQNQVMESYTVLSPEHPEASRVFATWLANQMMA